MPQAIPAVAAQVGAWIWGATGISAASAAVAGVAVTYGALIGGSMVISHQMKVAQSRKARNSLRSRGTALSVKEPTASRTIIYGRQRVGGTVIFMNTSGADNKWAHFVVVHADHEVDAFEKVYLGEDEHTPDGNGNVVAHDGYTYVKTHVGAPGATAESELVTDTGGVWTTNDTVSGCAYSYMRLQWNADKYPSGAPQLSALIRGKKVYDPRDEEQDPDDDSTWLWSENPALCILDYLRTSRDDGGLGCDADETPVASFITAANICDETVYSGKRYTCNGVVDTADNPESILADLLTSCAGTLVCTGGIWKLIAGADRATSAVFTLDHLRGPLAPQCGDSLRDTCNVVKGVFAGAETQWQPADLVPAENATYLAEDGEEIVRDIELPFTAYSSEGHRLLRIELEKARQDITIPLQLNLAGMAVTVGDIVALPFARYGWEAIGVSGKLFEIVNWKFVLEQTESGPKPGVDVVCREYSSAVWTDGDETTIDTAPNTTLPNPRLVEDVTGLTLAGDSYKQPDGSFVPRLKVSWTAAASEFIKSGGRICLEYKKHADSTWTVLPEYRADSGSVWITDALVGAPYDVRAKFVSVLGVRSAAYADSLTAHPDGFTVTADTTPPDDPTGLTATAGTGAAISLAWPAVDSADEYTIYRGTTSNTAAMSAVGQVAGTRFVDLSVSVPATYYYAIKAEDYLGNVSGFSNVASATTSSLPDPDPGISDTTPSNPSAPTLASSGTKVAGDGTVTAYLVINLPALPANAAGVNICYRTNGATGWIVSDQYDAARRTAVSTTTIDDLAVNTPVEVMAQAYSLSGRLSAVVAATSSPFTTPAAPAPSAPTSLSVSTAANDVNRIPPSYAGATGTKYAAGMLKWTAPANKDLAYYQIWRTAGTPTMVGRTRGTETEFALYTALMVNPATDDIYVKAVNTSGVVSSASSALAPGGYSFSSNYGTGSLAEQNSSSVNITGGSISGTTSIASTEFNSGSSRRIKKNIRTIKRPLALTKKLRGVRYDRRDGTRRNDVGLIAEEVAMVVPAVVCRDSRGRIAGLDYGRLVGVLVEAVKELSREVDKLKRSRK